LKKRALVGCPVIFQNQWMVHGDIRRTLFKVAYRIATRGHHVTQQLVGFSHRTSGAVNETRLDSAPGRDKARPIARSERPDVQTLHSICAFVQAGFRFPPAPAFFHRAGIFSATKLSAESFRTALSKKKPHGDARDHHHGDNNGYGYLCRSYR
jgi:hypothetical protein